MTESAATDQSFGHRWMSGTEVRQAFVAFFNERVHREVPSSSLVPHNDPSVLLTTAGMQQMTPYFLGLETPPALRMTSVQKCFRTVDIDEVGDLSHCTFFFMLGNFSVGDYFKRDSLVWSWEFLTRTLGLDAERLFPTVHPEDVESFEIWRDVIGVPEERIGKLSDNWWGPVGPTGPNGPDSEIYFDLGPEVGEIGGGPGESNRYLEIWNNVFMQYFQAPDGTREHLPKQNVDTGMGLERLTMLLQKQYSIYDTDLYQAIIQRAANLAGVTYGHDEQSDRSLRVIADHTRGATFLIGDGVLPGNEGRSYVLRRILRRAILNGRKLGLNRPFLADMSSVVIDQFASDYPALRDRQRQIERVLTHEEETFGRTLTTGLARFQTEAHEIIAGSPTGADQLQTVFPGASAFRLYDTFGFPFELTLELAAEEGMVVDQAEFDAAMTAQRLASRGKDAFKDASRDRAAMYVAAGGQKTEFVGYTETETAATILALVGTDGAINEAEAGQPVEVILDRTPFYGESGGQVGDKGSIRTETGLINIDDTFKPTPELFVHRGTVAEGFVSVNEAASARIDLARRRSIRRNHTATHLLHRALRLVLGTETHQAGSLVSPDRLRFDFTSLDAMTLDQLWRVAEIVNSQIIAADPVVTREMAFDEAQTEGAMALFGEKYGERVRVVGIAEFSRELCGGTHVDHTGQIGPFLIVSEGSVAGGVRRIEAVTGEAAINRMLKQQSVLEGSARDMRSTWTELPDQISLLQDRLRLADREIEQLRRKTATASVANIFDQAFSVGPYKVLSAEVSIASRADLRPMADHLRDTIQSGVLILGAVVDNQPVLLVTATADAVAAGVKAGDIVRVAALAMDGKGGGRADLAEAGGKNSAGLPEAVRQATALAVQSLTAGQ